MPVDNLETYKAVKDAACAVCLVSNEQYSLYKDINPCPHMESTDQQTKEFSPYSTGCNFPSFPVLRRIPSYNKSKAFNW